MSVRSSMPWPFRWISVAIVLGFCAAIGLWAFEFGRDIAGIDGGHGEQLSQLRREAAELKDQLSEMQEERDKALSTANISGTLLTAEKAVQEKLKALNQQLEAENRALRDDLGFFEKLIPATGGGGLAIRGLQAEIQNGRQLKWQVLVIQPLKNAPEFSGSLELTFTGVKAGAPWSASLPAVRPLKFRQYGRDEGVFEIPPQVEIHGISAKVLEGAVTKAVQSIKL